MIRDPRVLDDEVVPDHELVLHRRDELDALVEALAPDMFRNHVYAFGPTGTGKSTLAKVALERLEDEGREVDTTIINCWEHTSRVEALRTVANGLLSATFGKTSSLGEITEALREEPDRHRIAILDEADQLVDTDTLYNLHRAPELTVLYIGNDERDLFEGMADRVRSRVSTGGRIDFDPYSVDELAEILEARADHALRDDTVTMRQLEAIASAADGDARAGISALRIAARKAVENDHDRITDDDIQAAIPDARAELRKKSLSQLTTHQRIVYDLLREQGPLEPSELQAAYEDRYEDARSPRTVRRYLRKMNHYGLVTREGSRNNRTYEIITR